MCALARISNNVTEMRGMMATRKTIRFNPLDTLVPDSTTRRTGESPAAAKTQSPDPTTGSTRTSTARNQPRAKDSHIYMVATQIAQPPSSADLVQPHPDTGEPERVHQVAGRWRNSALVNAVADRTVERCGLSSRPLMPAERKTRSRASDRRRSASPPSSSETLRRRSGD